MKKFISILLGTILIILTACSTGSGTEKAKIEIIPEGTELSGTLIISTDTEEISGVGLFALADGFMDLHPGVEIEINETYDDYDSRVKYSEQLKVEMLAGEAPDLLHHSFDYSSNFAIGGLLMDLNSFIENDETFIKEDYFMNLLEASELGGKQYRMPLYTAPIEFIRFRVDVLEAAGIDPDTIDAVDYKLLYEIYDKAIASGEVPELKYIGKDGYGSMYFLAQEMAACFDRETMTANFETEEFIEYLETAKAHNAPSGGADGYLFIDGVDELIEATDFFAVSVTISPSNPQEVMGKDSKITKAYPVVTSAGELAVRDGLVSIPTNANNPGLAWEFIKYCIYESEEIQIYLDKDIPAGYWGGDRFSGSTPINKNNMEKYFQKCLQGFPEEYIEETISLVYTYDQYELISDIPSSDLRTALYRLVVDYYNNLLTAEECASAMQDRVEVYFAEIE